MKVMDDSGLEHQVEIIKGLFEDNDATLATMTTQINGKANTSHQHASSDVTVMTGYEKPQSTSAIADTDSLNVATGKLEKALDEKAPTASPVFTGTPRAATAPAGTNTTQLATTAFVKREISNQMALNEEMLQTINDLQEALEGDGNLVAQLTTQIGQKLDKVSDEYVKELSISGRDITVTNGDNSSYILQTQALPSSMTAAQASTGTSTTAMSVSPKVLNDLIESKVGSLSTGVSSVTTGGANGTIKVNGADVAVKGLGSMAYASTGDFATASHNHDTRYLSLVQATGTIIPANTDLDTLKTAGTYYCDGSTTAKTLNNCPYTSSNFKLAVMFHGSNKYGLQILYGYNDESIFVRRMNNGTWATTWRKVLYNNSTLDATKLSGTIPAACYTNTVYTHPTTAGNKHIPAGGSSGQILRWSADGTAVWGADNNTTYSNFVKSGSGAKAGLVPKPSTTAGTTKYLCEDGTWKVPPDTNTTYSNMTAATASAAGKAGLVPAPAAGKQTSFLRGDGAWVVPTNTTYSAFVKSGSTAAAGLVPKPSTTAGTTKYLCEDGTWKVPPDTNTAYSNFVKSGSSAASGLVPKPSTTAGTTKYLCEDATWKVPPNTVYTHPTTSGNKHIPSGGSSGQILRWSSDGTAVWGADNNTTYSAGTAALLTSGTDTTNRVWTAKMIADYVKSVASITTSASANGYMKFPNGIIVQWGKATGKTNGQPSSTVTFPTPFTTELYSLILTNYDGRVKEDGDAGNPNASEASVASVTTGNTTNYNKLTGFQFFTSPYITRVYWVAIGK